MTTCKTITVCLIGDDRAREYRVTWEGTAEFSEGRMPAALLRHQEREALVCQHPEHGWCSVGGGWCRDFEASPGYPEMTDERLEEAV